MNAPDKFTLPDVQSVVDHRNLPIQRVGVKGIVHPVKVQCGNADQGTVARIDMYVGLPATAKGTHMSRFLEILDAHQDALSCGSLRDMMQRMLVRLEADSGFMGFSFPFFVRKAAPVSGVESLMNYEGHLAVEVRDGQTTSTARVVVPVTSLCPCSRNISDYGAHNQRSHITISATTTGELELLDLIRVAETAASCELWGLLKRVDEKYVTERAYDNPKFVEDLVRDVALGLESIPGILAWTVESENFESIHNHSAYALIERDLRADGR